MHEWVVEINLVFWKKIFDGCDVVVFLHVGFELF